MGFRTSPIGRHREDMGTANHTIMLADTYLELLGVLNETEANSRWRPCIRSGCYPLRVLNETEANSRWRAVLARREGLVAVAMRAHDAEAARAAVAARGAEPEPLRRWGRAVQVAGGGAVEARFDTFQLKDEATPGLRLFFCRHLAPQATWAPGLSDHANTAVPIEAFHAVVEDPGRAARDTARLIGRTADGDTVTTGAGAFAFCTRADMAAWLAGAVPDASIPGRGLAALTLRVRSLELARAAIEAGGLLPVEHDGGLLVPPSRCACGEGRLLRAATGRDARHRRRVGLRQVDGGALPGAPAEQRRRPDHRRRDRSGRAAARGAPARGAADPDGVPGSLCLA
jgi:hypothetical protein